MFFKLSARNVSRSLKDYVVYFLTLVLGVCIFYMFNSIDSQAAMLDMKNAGSSSVDMLVAVIDFVSIFVTFVLAFLVLYANKFMIKRRKKELGTYLVLGMNRSRVSFMLLIETAIIGLLALVVGIVLGVFLSQGLAFVTASMFDVSVVSYRFIFSWSALRKCLFYFGIIFLVAMLFNSTSISKLSLIDLLYADRKNEELKIRSNRQIIAFLIIGIVLVGLSYYVAVIAGAAVINGLFGILFLICGVGTLFLFMSVSGIILKAVQKNKALYYKDLNTFSVRELASKVNTNFVSMTFICMMLFFTMVLMSTVTTFNDAFKEEGRTQAPYDVSYKVYDGDTAYDDVVIAEQLPKVGVDADTLFSWHHEFNVYDTGMFIKDLIDLSGDAEVARILDDSYLRVMTVSDYNTLMRQAGKPELAVGEGQYALFTLYEPLRGYIDALYANNTEIGIGGYALYPAGQHPIRENLWTTYGADVPKLMAIVPDAAVGALLPSTSVYNANYAGDKQATDSYLAEELLTAYDDFMTNAGIQLRISTRLYVVQNNSGITTTLIFVGIYLGFVFLVAGAAVLALQQLSGASDNKKRYVLLRKLGAEEGMINKSLLMQVGVYFLMPLVLAIIHSIVGIDVMNSGIMKISSVNIISGSWFMVLFLAVIYGAYFLATYAGCKRIVLQRE